MRIRSAIISILLVATIAGAFILIDDTHDQTVGGTKTHVIPVIGSEMCANLHVPPTNGEIQYCSDCIMPSSPCTAGGNGAMAAYINGRWECFPGGNAVIATATPAATATPQPTATPQAGQNTPTPQPTATPVPTDTPLIDLLYSGKLNLGANASGTPLGLVTITANATPGPHDRHIICAPPNATPVAYTMPPATGTGRIMDMTNKTGNGSCSMARAASDLLNDSTADVLANKWDGDTCQDILPAQWACRNLPTPTPTP